MYVGIAKCPWRRLGQHFEGSHWARNVANVTIEWFDSRDQALTAEADAIVGEFPLFNKAGKGRTEKTKDWHKPGYMAEYMRKYRALKKAVRG